MAATAKNAQLALALVRIACGLLLLVAGWNSKRAQAPDGPALESWIQSARDSSGWLARTWADMVLLENPAALAALWPWLLIACGALLTLGALTRPAAALALVMTVHAWAYGPSTHHGLHFLLAVCLGVVAWVRAGRELGLDAALDHALPRSVTWAPPSRDAY